MPWRWVLFGGLVLAVSHAGDPAPTLSFSGYGNITFGVTIKEAEALLKAKPIRTNLEEDEACYYVRFEAYPGADFMVEDGRIVRVDAPAEAPNVLSIRIGMTLSDITSRVKFKTPIIQEFGDGIHYMALLSQSGKSEIYLEMFKGRVTYIRGGLLPAVGYAEGCL
jgi:hypothetical protein